LIATANAAFRAAEHGAVHLVQRRLGSHRFSYVAVRDGSRRAEAFPCAQTMDRVRR
jgi:hypothetical protein